MKSTSGFSLLQHREDTYPTFHKHSKPFNQAENTIPFPLLIRVSRIVEDEDPDALKPATNSKGTVSKGEVQEAAEKNLALNNGISQLEVETDVILV